MDALACPWSWSIQRIQASLPLSYPRLSPQAWWWQPSTKHDYENSQWVSLAVAGLGSSPSHLFDARRPGQLRAQLAIARPTPLSQLVPRRQVWHLHPLGSLLGARLGRFKRVRRMVLEPHRGQESWQCLATVSRKALRNRFPIPEFCADVPCRTVQSRSVGGHFLSLRGKIYCTDLEASRRAL